MLNRTKSYNDINQAKVTLLKHYLSIFQWYEYQLYDSTYYTILQEPLQNNLQRFSYYIIYVKIDIIDLYREE